MVAAPAILPSPDLHALVGTERDVKNLSVVCVGAHPDDPETGCGGTLAKFAADGDRVHIVYLTRGEAGIRGGHWDNTARVRSAEALQACELLKGSGTSRIRSTDRRKWTMTPAVSSRTCYSA